MSQTTREAGRSLIHNQEWRLVLEWDTAKNTKRLLTSVPPAAIAAHVQWSVSVDPCPEVKIHKENQALECHKAPGSSGLFIAVLKTEQWNR